jgi:hypothetical protein
MFATTWNQAHLPHNTLESLLPGETRKKIEECVVIILPFLVHTEKLLNLQSITAAQLSREAGGGSCLNVCEENLNAC